MYFYAEGKASVLAFTLGCLRSREKYLFWRVSCSYIGLENGRLSMLAGIGGGDGVWREAMAAPQQVSQLQSLALRPINEVIVCLNPCRSEGGKAIVGS